MFSLLLELTTRVASFAFNAFRWPNNAPPHSSFPAQTNSIKKAVSWVILTNASSVKVNFDDVIAISANQLFVLYSECYVDIITFKMVEISERSFELKLEQAERALNKLSLETSMKRGLQNFRIT